MATTVLLDPERQAADEANGDSAAQANQADIEKLHAPPHCNPNIPQQQKPHYESCRRHRKHGSSRS
jgi:hypothetical protein